MGKLKNLRKLILQQFGYYTFQGCDGIEKSSMLWVAQNASAVRTQKVSIRLRTL